MLYVATAHVGQVVAFETSSWRTMLISIHGRISSRCVSVVGEASSIGLACPFEKGVIRGRWSHTFASILFIHAGWMSIFWGISKLHSTLSLNICSSSVVIVFRFIARAWHIIFSCSLALILSINPFLDIIIRSRQDNSVI